MNPHVRLSSVGCRSAFDHEFLALSIVTLSSVSVILYCNATNAPSSASPHSNVRESLASPVCARIVACSIDRARSKPLFSQRYLTSNHLATEIFSFVHQSIPYARFGPQVTWARGVAFQFSTQLAHVNSQVLILVNTIRTPDIFQQLTVRDDLACMRHQDHQ